MKVEAVANHWSPEHMYCEVSEHNRVVAVFLGENCEKKALDYVNSFSLKMIVVEEDQGINLIRISSNKSKLKFEVQKVTSTGLTPPYFYNVFETTSSLNDSIATFRGEQSKSNAIAFSKMLLKTSEKV